MYVEVFNCQEDYESVISDIEETLSILSRNSRSTTPASRTPTPSLGQFNYFSMSDLASRTNCDKAVSDKHIIPIVTVFDDLKDYLSDSDLSLEYQIARQRRRQKNMKNLNKQAQLSNILTSKNKLMGQKEHAEMKEDSTMSVHEKHGLKRNLMFGDDKNNPFKSASCSNIDKNAFESPETSISYKKLSGKKTAEFVKNDKSTVNTRILANEWELGSHKDPLLKNKQENDSAVRKINSSGEQSGLPLTPGAVRDSRGQSLEPILEERKSIRDKTYTGLDSSGGGKYNTLGNPRSRDRESLNKLQQEKENNCNNFYQTNSLQRKKQINTASLGSLIENLEPTNHNTSGYAKKILPQFSDNQKISNDSVNGFATSFSNVFSEKFQPKFAVKKSVVDCAKDLNNQPSIKERAKNSNISEIDLIRQYMGFDDKSEKESIKNLHEFRDEILSVCICIFFQFPLS